MKKHASGSAAIRDWILATARAGHGIDDIISLMVDAGYTSRQARQWAAKTLDRPGAALAIDAAPAIDGKRTRHPEPPAVLLGEHRAEVSLCVEAPPLRVLDNLLTHDECAELVELARPRLSRALTVDTSGRHQVDATRTSSGMFFGIGETALIERIEQRIADLVGLPVAHGEGLQVLHYQPGEQYEPHFDWFDPNVDGFKVLAARGGQRVASVIMYLNSPAGGGGTHFPKIGLTVCARRGSALYFAYEGGDQSSLHAGLPVTEGEKWIATKWLREAPFG